MDLIFDKIGNDKVNVSIAPEVLNIWKKFRQNSRRNREACGVLIGGYDAKNNMIVIENCTKPMKGDICKRRSFILQDEGHQLAVDKDYVDSNGTSFYLGTWHTHPVTRPSPSCRDRTDWKKCIARNPLIPSFIFAIVGINSVFLHTRLKGVSLKNKFSN